MQDQLVSWCLNKELVYSYKYGYNTLCGSVLGLNNKLPYSSERMTKWSVHGSVHVRVRVGGKSLHPLICQDASVTLQKDTQTVTYYMYDNTLGQIDDQGLLNTTIGSKSKKFWNLHDGPVTISGDFFNWCLNHFNDIINLCIVCWFQLWPSTPFDHR